MVRGDEGDAGLSWSCGLGWLQLNCYGAEGGGPRGDGSREELVF